MTACITGVADLTANLMSVVDTGDGIATQVNAIGAALLGSLVVAAAVLYIAGPLHRGQAGIRDDQAVIHDALVDLGVRLARVHETCRTVSAVHADNRESVERLDLAVEQLGTSYMRLLVGGADRSAVPEQRPRFLN